MNLAPRHQTSDQANQTVSAGHNYTNIGIENKQNKGLIKTCSGTPQPPYHGACSQNVFIGGGGLIVGITSPRTSLLVMDSRSYIDKGLFLAPKGHSIQKEFSVQKSDSGALLLDTHIQSFKSFFNNKITKRERECLNCLLANLLNAYATSSQLVYSRRTNKTETRYLIRVIDYLERYGFVHNVIGKDNEYQGNSSWLIPMPKLVHQFKSFKVRIALNQNMPMIQIRGEDKKPLKLDKFKRRQAKLFRESSEPVQEYNRLWLSHVPTLHGNPIVPYMKRVFNYDLNHGGRFYGYGCSFQSLPSNTRKMILIDGEPTIEPDFKAMHFAILYSLAGIQLEGDPYTVEGFDRRTIKLTSLVLLNSEDLEKFKANVTKSGNPKVKAECIQYQKDFELFIKRSSQGLPCQQPYKPKSLQGFIEGMPDHIKGSELLEAILKRHKPIAYLFGADRIGLKLQNKDSLIMTKTITALAKQNIPVLPVHDSVRCRESDLEAVCKAMREAFESETGFSCTIDY